MELWVKDDRGEILAVYMGGRLQVHRFFEKTVFAYELFSLLVQMMNVGGGASYGGPLASPAPVEDLGGP